MLNCLIFGASYGSLIAAKLIEANHNVKIFCSEKELELIQKFNLKVTINSISKKQYKFEYKLNDQFQVYSSYDFSLNDIDIVFFAMQEHHFNSENLVKILNDISKKKIPIVSILNLLPYTYLSKFKKVKVDNIQNVYKSLKIWDKINTKFFTTTSPDPQIFFPNREYDNSMIVTLPSNFKVAKFEDDKSNQILDKLSHSIRSLKHPIQIKIYDTSFVPLAKWPMLICGNYRCVKKKDFLPICDVVNSDLLLSEKIYNQVIFLCKKIGAENDIFVPFNHYQKRSKMLTGPSSVAKALKNGSNTVERTDILISQIADQFKIKIDGLDEIVNNINNWIKHNTS